VRRVGLRLLGGGVPERLTPVVCCGSSACSQAAAPAAGLVLVGLPVCLDRGTPDRLGGPERRRRVGASAKTEGSTMLRTAAIILCNPCEATPNFGEFEAAWSD